MDLKLKYNKSKCNKKTLNKNNQNCILFDINTFK